MLIHIVKNGETIDDIINTYRVSYEELRRLNSHVSNLNNLIGGTKLKVPLITEEIEQVLEATECFVSDYYSKISEDILNEIEQRPIEVKEEKKEEVKNTIEDNKDLRAYPGIMPPKKRYGGR